MLDEALPMTTARRPCTDVNELINRLKELTAELTELHGDLYWIAMQAQSSSDSEQPAEAAGIGVEDLGALKSAVDTMRLTLWNYIETASELDLQKAAEGSETQRLQRVTKFLELLRKRLGAPVDQEPVTFIERISAAMKDRFRDKVA
jgi:hypothetical protein